MGPIPQHWLYGADDDDDDDIMIQQQQKCKICRTDSMWVPEVAHSRYMTVEASSPLYVQLSARRYGGLIVYLQRHVGLCVLLRAVKWPWLMKAVACW